MQIVGILAFIVALLASVMIHELGHYLTAKKFGMKVTEFFLGFGQKLWSTKRGETEFGLKAIPAGGYCRIEGMSPNDVMEIGEEGRAFYKASSARKLIVLGAGSFAHFLLGFFLLFFLFVGIGTPAATPILEKVLPDSAAASAGLLPGDEITAINGKVITDWPKDVLAIRGSNGKPVTLALKRGGQGLTFTIQPTLKDIGGGEKRWLIGFITSVEVKRTNAFTGVKRSVLATKELTSASFKALLKLPEKIPALWGQTVAGEKRDPNGLVGVVGVARVTGQVADSEKLTLRERFSTFIIIIASLNIFVGIFNLLPILPLDGGHMAVAIADAIRAAFARLRGRPRPAPIDVLVLTPVTMVVFVILVTLTLLLLVADIINPVILNL